MTIEDVKAIIQGDETRTLEVKKTTGELKDGMTRPNARIFSNGVNRKPCRKAKNAYNHTSSPYNHTSSPYNLKGAS